MEAPALPLVVIVDPQEETRELYDLWFWSQGFSVATAARGDIGAALALAYQPELVVTDLRLERLDGLEMIHRLRRAPATAQIPILVLTACGDRITIDRARLAGATVARKLEDLRSLERIVSGLVPDDVRSAPRHRTHVSIRHLFDDRWLARFCES